MAKSRSQRLEVVLTVAERKRREAERFLAEARQRVEQGEQGIQQLQTYLGEYQQQFTQHGREGLSVGALQSQQAFLQKINATIIAQEQALVHARDQLQQVQAHWQQAYAREKGIEELVRKARESELQQADKQLQREIDERSQHRRPQYI
ncbi:flagellar export protein FliJ [Marinobacterium sp. AK62]|uniref:Flagellar FliJ protein n=1 Tax=Marinobacterium alkalitolerans TaxID=1542925 RepID=A0ABS3Z9Y8_9GAMM|nr:flagellar export protein FliJ [Marinobacterium alkalitolerans]MBP0048522.1 flagellar export protein FliJ [Marinobacterium alkalitolerans]